MSITINKEFVPSSDGIHALSGKVYIPEENPKGLFHVVHGMTEHIERYDFFMRKLAEDGYICFGYDHLGHGKTAKNADELGFIAHKNGWDHLAKDVSVFAEAMKKKYGETLPYYLMGHSMGSFVSRLAAEKYIKPDKFIIMGTGGPNPSAGIGLIAIDIAKIFRGEKYISKTIDNLAFGSFNSHFEDENDPGDRGQRTERKICRRPVLHLQIHIERHARPCHPQQKGKSRGVVQKHKNAGAYCFRLRRPRRRLRKRRNQSL